MSAEKSDDFLMKNQSVDYPSLICYYSVPGYNSKSW